MFGRDDILCLSREKNPGITNLKREVQNEVTKDVGVARSVADKAFEDVGVVRSVENGFYMTCSSNAKSRFTAENLNLSLRSQLNAC